jgi:hypothetical protein
VEPTKPSDALLPPALLAEIEAMAAAEHRPAREMLREAVERYLQDRRPFAGVNNSGSTAPLRTPQQAAARMLERRKFHPLPEGMSIRDLMTFGRA